MQRLLDHDWPGNVRELENAIEHAFVLCSVPRIIHPNHLPLEIREKDYLPRSSAPLGSSMEKTIKSAPLTRNCSRPGSMSPAGTKPKQQGDLASAELPCGNA